MQIGAPQDKAHGHKIDKVDFLKWAHGQAHRHSVFGQMQIGAPQDEARGHKIDIVDFLKGAHG